MSIFSVQARKHTAYYDHLLSAGRTTARAAKDNLTNTLDSANEDLSAGSERSSANRTYVVCKGGNAPQSPHHARLTLQRRSKRKSGAEGRFGDSRQSSSNTPKVEKRLTLQRRTRTPTSMEQRLSTNARPAASKPLTEANGKEPALLHRSSVKESAKSRVEIKTKMANGSSTPVLKSKHLEEDGKCFKTPTRRTQFEKISTKRDVFEKLAAKEAPKLIVKSTKRERSNSRVQKMCDSKDVLAPKVCKAPEHGATPGAARPSTSTAAQTLTQPEAEKQTDDIQMENSAVTVAVRVRPFNTRENAETPLQVIFMNGQETVVHHPDTKQSYNFTYDFSFYSVNDGDSAFATQQTVYNKLAKPLLHRAFEGYNTCLFAYGQTGSGKSYTMMGFGDEVGIIPRFCDDLFSELKSMKSEKVHCHVEMSYFEVYNEKIHDLLITRDVPSQRQMPLRVREHPVHGPYVEDLSANVVTCYEDIQGWLKLGNKQRATAATGMNDKSSRSHSVFTLVLTQTKTEVVEGEEHDHSISSKINLVDLAGSERCNSAQTSGDRLREGASINKSLLTLGKVISALSEQALSRKKVFIPYRESVLTWLLKESLGGNSKTAMIATLSPAGSNVEESLSTLRYAQQARTIINVAMVNEDTNAKLIRELKAEVEKLRAAQMSAQGVEPERVKQFQLEIVALRNKLCQQEREMLEAHRAWREKLEEAEVRKREETKESHKAGITFKVDNRLPNLVNLNEDPQLSEMLLYMIKEGNTTVGKLKCDATHDIQLTGALIADLHCVINNVHDTVSITPMENAKTFVNGNLISEALVLHHGDRVILGGDHYFRFNHPAEVQSGKRVSCWTGAGDGQKDFEFAKNEMLAAQRAELEAEIEEANLKAKKEMMQGIQMAKEVAQKELLDQKALYENRIRALERDLLAESDRKRQQELDQQKMASQMQDLKMAKYELEQEVNGERKRLRLHMEAKAMEEHRVSQAKIVDALEQEKNKISRELEEIQKRKALRENQKERFRTASPKWDSMKLSLMIEEANKISAKLRKNTLFSRHESTENDHGGLHVRVQNTKLGISTFWTLEKFQNNMAVMRELDQENSSHKEDDVFYGPDDEWEQDISAASTSNLSRRRSKSLLKSRRISGKLYEIRVHPIQSLLSGPSHSAGLMGGPKPPSTCPTSADAAIPGICKDLIGRSAALLGRCSETEDSLVDRLASDLCVLYSAAQTISDLYEGLDEDSTDNVFTGNAVAQALLIKATVAVESAVLVSVQWLARVNPSTGLLYTLAEELRSQVKKMAGFFQLLIQGCESEISSMVTEARRKSSQCLTAALVTMSHLAAVTDMPLNTISLSAHATGKTSITASLLKGTSKGLHSLLEQSLNVTREMMREAQLACPRNPLLQSLKSMMLDLARALQNFMLFHITGLQENAEEEESTSCCLKLRTKVTQLYQTNKVIGQLNSALSAAVRGKDTDVLQISRDLISSSAKCLDELITSLFEDRKGFQSPTSPKDLYDDIHIALRSLCTWSQQTAEDTADTSDGSLESDASGQQSATTHSTVRNRIYSKVVYALPSGAKVGSPRWV